jgi:hypothetical protein
MTQARENADKLMSTLDKIGYYTKLIESFNIVKVYFNSEWWYTIEELCIPDPENILNANIKAYDFVCATLTMRYKDNTICTVKLNKYRITINGNDYYLGNDEDDTQCIGHIINNVYTCYIDKWFLRQSYPYAVNFNEHVRDLIPSARQEDVLNEDLMPEIQQPVDIQNKGFKLVNLMYRINDNGISDFTVFGHRGSITDLSINYIADGKYSASGREVFRYLDKNEEAYALLIDPLTETAELASATKNIKLTIINQYLVSCKNGFYDGFKIKGDTSNLGHNILNVRVYRYGYTFFAVDKFGDVVELDMYRPNSGYKTKMAI